VEPLSSCKSLKSGVCNSQKEKKENKNNNATAYKVSMKPLTLCDVANECACNTHTYTHLLSELQVDLLLFFQFFCGVFSGPSHIRGKQTK